MERQTGDRVTTEKGVNQNVMPYGREPLRVETKLEWVTSQALDRMRKSLRHGDNFQSDMRVQHRSE